jgi:hypothetical protein
MLNNLINKLGNYRYNSGDDYSFCCPFCIKVIGNVDTGFHLYINISKLFYFCQKCGSRGRVKRILKKDELLSQTKIGDWKNIKSKLLYDHFYNSTLNDSSIELPRDYMEVIDRSDAHLYLKSRGISDEQIQLYRIGFGTENLEDIDYEKRKYYAGSGRIIFPDYDENNKLQYWVARTYVNHRNKYRNPIGAKSNNQLYNLVMAKNYDTVVITEGVISAIKGGKNCVATYGKHVTEKQVIRLTESRFKAYVVALDGDARDESVSLARRLSSCGCKEVNVVKYKNIEDDPANVGNFEELVKKSFCCTFSNLVKERVLT